MSTVDTERLTVRATVAAPSARIFVLEPVAVRPA
jgi:hypothetical protein